MCIAHSLFYITLTPGPLVLGASVGIAAGLLSRRLWVGIVATLLGMLIASPAAVDDKFSPWSLGMMIAGGTIVLGAVVVRLASRS